MPDLSIDAQFAFEGVQAFFHPPFFIGIRNPFFELKPQGEQLHGFSVVLTVDLHGRSSPEGVFA